MFFRTTQELEYFFCHAKREFFFHYLTLGYMTKTLNQIIFFSSTKIRIFFSATLGIRILYFFRKKHNPSPPPPPPLKLNGRSLINMIFEICKIPDIFRLRVVTPCYKRKRKPISDPNSYRKITVTSAVGKVTEKLHLKHSSHPLDIAQNPLQKGFTRGTSNSHVVVIIFELIAVSYWISGCSKIFRCSWA